jgi:hypothetical protein
MIEIKHRINGKVLYTAESAQDVKTAVEEAAKAGANLRSADLRSADLGSANLRSADLGYANLRSANLRSANLRSADLRSADLRSADLGYANLRSADLRSANLRSADLRSANLRSANLGWDHPLRPFLLDFWSILDHAPVEVAGLRAKMVAGEIEGSTYEGACSCLAGTIAKGNGCGIEGLKDELGIEVDVDRPAEQWFIAIRQGDKPLPIDTEEWETESVFRISVALAWLDEWIESRTAVGAVLLGVKAGE